MDVAGLLLELYGRIPPLARSVLDGVDLATLTEPPASGANPIAWLVWHAARVQDHHVAELLDADQTGSAVTGLAVSGSSRTRRIPATGMLRKMSRRSDQGGRRCFWSIWMQSAAALARC